MRTSRVPTSSTARWISERFVTSSASGVTRLSGCCSVLRVPAYTLFAPRLRASSTRARPMPRFAPVIKIVLFWMFIGSPFDRCPFYWLLRIACRGGYVPQERFRFLPCFGFPKSHLSVLDLAVSLCPAEHASEWSDDCPSQLGQRVLDGNGLRLRPTSGD